MVPTYDVIIVGAGQAGLAVAYYLRDSGLRFALLDSADRVGGSWPSRWQSLRLFTPARYSSLPGLAFPGPPDHYPSRDEVATYLASYASTFQLPVHLRQRVIRLRRTGDVFELDSETDRFRARQVVVATGPFHEPAVPEFAGHLSTDVTQVHSSRYRTPADLPEGNTLVVGAGNSGWQIAEELARNRRVYLSQGRRLPRVPRRLLGRSLFGWLETFGIMKVRVDSPLGQRMKANDEVVIGVRPEALLRNGRLQLRDRATWAEGTTVGFADGDTLRVDVVIWATGFRSNFDWLQVPVLDEQGEPRQRRGITAIRGLHFIGLRWQHTSGSALLGWVARDASFIADRILGGHSLEATPQF